MVSINYTDVDLVILDLLFDVCITASSHATSVVVACPDMDEQYVSFDCSGGILRIEDSVMVKSRKGIIQQRSDSEFYHRVMCRMFGRDCIIIDHLPKINIVVPEGIDIKLFSVESLQCKGMLGDLFFESNDDITGLVDSVASIKGTVGDDIKLFVADCRGEFDLTVKDNGSLTVGSVFGPVTVNNEDDTDITIKSQTQGALVVNVRDNGSVSVTGTFSSIRVLNTDDGDIILNGPVAGDVEVTLEDNGNFTHTGSIGGNVVAKTTDDGSISTSGEVEGYYHATTEDNGGVTHNGTVALDFVATITDDGSIACHGNIGSSVHATTKGDGSVVINGTVGGNVEAFASDDGDVLTEGTVKGNYIATLKGSYATIQHTGEILGEVSGELIRL
jgi:hypothetical protein